MFLIVFLLILFSVAFILNKLNQGVTAAAIRETGCEINCKSYLDCQDDNSCTKNVCLNPGKCDSNCIFEPIENCN